MAACGHQWPPLQRVQQGPPEPTYQSRFDVVKLERFTKQPIVVEMDLAYAKVGGRALIGIHVAQLFGGTGLRFTANVGEIGRGVVWFILIPRLLDGVTQPTTMESTCGRVAQMNRASDF